MRWSCTLPWRQKRNLRRIKQLLLFPLLSDGCQQKYNRLYGGSSWGASWNLGAPFYGKGNVIAGKQTWFPDRIAPFPNPSQSEAFRCHSLYRRTLARHFADLDALVSVDLFAGPFAHGGRHHLEPSGSSRFQKKIRIEKPCRCLSCCLTQTASGILCWVARFVHQVELLHAAVIFSHPTISSEDYQSSGQPLLPLAVLWKANSL